MFEEAGNKVSGALNRAAITIRHANVLRTLRCRRRSVIDADIFVRRARKTEATFACDAFSFNYDCMYCHGMARAHH